MVDEGHDLQSQPELPPSEPPTIVPVAAQSAAPIDQVDEVRDPDGRIEHPHVRFERTDISFRGVMAVIVAAACAVSLQLYLTMKFYRHDEARQQAAKQTAFPLAADRKAALPVEPRLEQLDRLAGDESPDARRRRATEEAKLHAYGDTDEADFVHVPIDWAISQAAERLPSKATKVETPAKDRGLLDSGEPNSGRLLRGE
jgi:hypothetical protein